MGARVRPTAVVATAARMQSVASEARLWATAAPIALVNPGLARKLLTINPHILDVLHPAAEGEPRDRLTVPVSPVDVPSDAVLYEEPADATKRLYLPRYRLRSQAGRYEIGVAAAPDGRWRLTAGIERFPAPELGAGVQGAAELPHDIAVFFRYGAGPTHAIERVVDFDELVEDERGVTVAVALDLAERDALLFAFQTPAAAPTLVVRRAFAVAIRIPGPSDEAETAVRVRDHRRRTPSAGLTTPVARGGRASIDAGLLATAVRPLAFEAQIFRPLRPRRQEARYRTVQRALDDVADPEPFVLDPRLHAYVYEGATVGGTGAAEFRRIVSAHPPGSAAARFHGYFQDVTEPWLFYYLPDRFKLSRRESLPFLPRMVVRIAAPDGAIESAAVTVDFVVEPWVDTARLRAAVESLRREVPAGARHTEPELRPMQARASLRLRLPGAAGVTLSDQGDVAIDLANGFVHGVTVPLDGFRQLYAAAYSRDATGLFSGQVLVETGLSAPEAIPLEIRFADTEGELLAFFEEPSDVDGVVAVRMQNGIESPLRLTSLPVRLRLGDQEVDADLEGLDLATPVDLAPEEEVSFRVRPRAALTGEGVPTALFDTSAVEVLPDPERILPLISDTTVPAEYEREIDVMTLPELLGEATDPTSILLINVEFRGGGSLKLSRDQSAGVAQVRLPLMDLLLGRDTQGRYGYRQQIIHRNGAQVVDPDWREADFGVLVLPVA